MDNYEKPGYKDGDDVLMEETPSDPSELRRYIEVIGVFAEEINANKLKFLYQESVNLLEYWEKENISKVGL